MHHVVVPMFLIEFSVLALQIFLIEVNFSYLFFNLHHHRTFLFYAQYRLKSVTSLQGLLQLITLVQNIRKRSPSSHFVLYESLFNSTCYVLYVRVKAISFADIDENHPAESEVKYVFHIYVKFVCKYVFVCMQALLSPLVCTCM